MKVISLSGLISSGKDTAAAYLIEKHGYQRLSFSAVLKDAAHAVFGWDRGVLEGSTKEQRDQREQVDPWWSSNLDMDDVSPRSMLQFFGTEVMRGNLHQNIWVLALKRRMLSADPDAKFVATDTRFFNEFQMMQDMGATLCGIHRKLPKWLDKFYEYVNRHLECSVGMGLMSIDMRNPLATKEVRIAATRFFQISDIHPTPHQSEWEHLLWNKYSVILDNTKSLDHLYEQVEKLA
jgi:hypothetical protein